MLTKSYNYRPTQEVDAGEFKLQGPLGLQTEFKAWAI